MIKENSPNIPAFKDYVVAPIEESVSFNSLNDVARQYFPDHEESVVFRILWKFQICLKVAEAISKKSNFPTSDHERRLKSFLGLVDSGGKYRSVAEKLKALFESFKVEFDLTLAGVPLSVGVKKAKLNDIKHICAFKNDVRISYKVE